MRVVFTVCAFLNLVCGVVSFYLGKEMQSVLCLLISIVCMLRRKECG